MTQTSNSTEGKTLAELKEAVMSGEHVCAPTGDGGTSYVFRVRGNGPITHMWGYAPGKHTLYSGVTLIKENEQGYDPMDYNNLLTNYQGPEQQPIWQVCVIPSELMAQFLVEIDENAAWWEEHNAPVKKILEERQKQKEVFNNLLGDIQIDL